MQSVDPLDLTMRTCRCHRPLRTAQFRSRPAGNRLRSVQSGPGDSRATSTTTAPARTEPVTAVFLERQARVRLAPRHAARRTPRCRCPSSRTWSPCVTRPASSASCATCRTAGGWSTSSTTRRFSRCASSSTTTSSGPRPGRRPGRATAEVVRRSSRCVRGRRGRRVRRAGRATAAARSSYRRTRNLVHRDRAANRNCPTGVQPSERIWHSRDLLDRRRPARRHRPGAGSSWSAPGRAPPRSPTTCTARFPAPRSARCSPGTATRPADDSSFANRIFDPAAVDDFFAAPDGGQADAAGLPPQHQLLGGRPGPHRGAVPALPTRRRSRATSGCASSTSPGCRDVERRRRRRAGHGGVPAHRRA